MPDFGLFDIETSYFATDPNGNETFPTPNGGVAYPIYFWTTPSTGSRPRPRTTSMAFFLSYASVTPNFLSSYSGRADVPGRDRRAG